jgi:hypothetical protein
MEHIDKIKEIYAIADYEVPTEEGDILPLYLALVRIVECCVNHFEEHDIPYQSVRDD